MLISSFPSTPDINPIENVFHLVNRKLKDDAVELNIVSEHFKTFSDPVKSTLLDFPVNIDKVIDSMHNRMKSILERRGQRLKY